MIRGRGSVLAISPALLLNLSSPEVAILGAARPTGSRHLDENAISSYQEQRMRKKVFDWMLKQFDILTLFCLSMLSKVVGLSTRISEG